MFKLKLTGWKGIRRVLRGQDLAGEGNREHPRQKEQRVQWLVLGRTSAYLRTELREQDGKQRTVRLDKWTGQIVQDLVRHWDFILLCGMLQLSAIALNTQKFVLKVLYFLHKLFQRRVICFYWPPCFHSVEHLLSFMLLVIFHYVFMFTNGGQDCSVLIAIAGVVQPISTPHLPFPPRFIPFL